MALSATDFLPVWAFLAANIATPGPNVLTTIALSIGSGRGAGLGSATGVGLGISLWCVGMTLGVSTLLSFVPVLQRGLSIAAIFLLASFAIRYFRAALNGYRAKAGHVAPAFGSETFSSGFRRALLVNAMNPKALTSWLAILGLFPVAGATLGDIAILCLGACMLSFSIHAIYAVAFSTRSAVRAYLKAGWMLQALAGVLFSLFLIRILIEF